MERTCARRRDAQVRCQPAVGIDFVRRKGQHGTFCRCVGQPFDRAEEETDVGRDAIHIRVAGHDRDDQPFRLGVRQRSNGQCLGRRRQPGDVAAGHVEARACHRVLQQRPQRQ